MRQLTEEMPQKAIGCNITFGIDYEIKFDTAWLKGAKKIDGLRTLKLIVPKDDEGLGNWSKGDLEQGIKILFHHLCARLIGECERRRHIQYIESTVDGRSDDGLMMSCETNVLG